MKVDENIRLDCICSWARDSMSWRHTISVGLNQRTNTSGNVNQHLQYMPFGETFVNQRNSNDIRFKFTGKERDAETGYTYFGARYYSSDISVWLSVDPLASRFPHISGYAYLNNSPIMYTDPWGLAPDDPPSGANPDLYENNTPDGQEYRGNGSYTHTESGGTSVPDNNTPTTGGQTSQEPQKPTAPTGRYRALPIFTRMENHYPKYGPQYPGGGVSDLAFAKLAGGKVKYNIEASIYRNTCALRVSHSLTKSGESLPKVPGRGNSSSNSAGRWYYPKVAVLSRQLSLLYGPPAVSNTSNLADLQGKKGIIIFHTHDMYSDASGHATLWNGSQALGGNHDYLPLLGSGVTASLWITP